MRFLCLTLLCSTLCAQRPQAAVVIGVDGLSAASLEKANAPNIKALMKRGAYSLKARGVIPTVSSPNWSSILSGAGPEQHGVTSNEWQRDKHEIDPVCTGIEPIFPTIFGVLHAAKPTLRLAVIHDWDGFGRLFERSAVNHIARVEHSAETVKAAIAYWNREKPHFLLVHLDDVDHVGHSKGWEGEHYLAEVERVDALIGQLVSAVGDTTLILVTADHGGTGTKHGNLRMNELQIPIIMAGPGVKGGELPAGANNFDIAPTLSTMFKVAPHSCWVGKSLVKWR